MDDFYAQTFLVVTDDLPSNPAMDTFAQCLTRDPHSQGLPYHRPTYVYVDFPIDGPRLCPPPPVLQIGLDRGPRDRERPAPARRD